MTAFRVGMIVPSLNTIAEDDFRLFCPPEIAYHVHRIRLRRDPGVVTPEDLARANHEAEDAGRTLADLRPTAIAFNCTGSSVADGKFSDRRLAERMTEALGIPTTNTMIAIKQALEARKIRSLVHLCPFAGDSSEIERRSLEESGFDVLSSVPLGFTDARVAAKMPPEEIAALARQHDCDRADGILLSCANVRALEAAAAVEEQTGKPVVTSNQAMLWAVARLAGWRGVIEGGGSLMRH
jgi:maleate isomerase